MIDFRELKQGDVVAWIPNEFDTASPKATFATITDTDEEHALAIGDDMKLWIDEYTQNDFYMAEIVKSDIDGILYRVRAELERD